MKNIAIPEAWRLLFSNQFSAAQAAFHDHPDPVESLRGLGWLAYLAGQDELVLKTWGALLELAPQHWSAVAVFARLLDIYAVRDDLAQLQVVLERVNSRSSPELRRLGYNLELAGPSMRWRARCRGGWHGLQPIHDPLLCPVSQIRSGRDEDIEVITAVHSPVPQIAWLEYDHRAPLSLWLNGKAIAYRPTMGGRYRLELPFRLKVALRRGWNTVRAQTRDDFRLRWRDEFDEVLDLPSRPTLADFGTAAPLNILPTSPWMCAFIPYDAPDGFLWRADHMRRLNDREAALAELEILERQFPESAAVHWGMAQCWAGRPQADSHIDLAKKFPECYLARLQSFNWGPMDALRDLAESRPDHAHTWIRLYWFHLEESLDREPLGPILEHLSGLLKPSVVKNLCGWCCPPEPATPLPSPQRRRFIQLHLDGEPLDDFESPDFAEAYRLLEALCASEPDSWLFRQLGNVHWRVGKFDKALHCFRQCCRYAPRDYQVRVDLAKAYSEVGQLIRARRTYGQAYRMNPAETHLRILLGQGPPLDALEPPISFSPPWASQPIRVVEEAEIVIIEPEQTRPTEEVVLREVRETVFSDFATLTYYRVVLRVNEEGIFSCTFPPQLAAGSCSLEVSKVYRPDGRVWDTRSVAQGAWATYHDCHPGDLFEACWRLGQPPSERFSRHLGFNVAQRCRYSLFWHHSLRLNGESGGTNLPEWQSRHWEDPRSLRLELCRV